MTKERMLAEHSDTCKKIGYKVNSPEHKRCVTELYAKQPEPKWTPFTYPGHNTTSVPNYNGSGSSLDHTAPAINDSVIQTPDAYGPGIHSDQYGRPVTVQPAY